MCLYSWIDWQNSLVKTWTLALEVHPGYWWSGLHRTNGQDFYLQHRLGDWKGELFVWLIPVKCHDALNESIFWTTELLPPYLFQPSLGLLKDQWHAHTGKTVLRYVLQLLKFSGGFLSTTHCFAITLAWCWIFMKTSCLGSNGISSQRRLSVDIYHHVQFYPEYIKVYWKIICLMVCSADDIHAYSSKVVEPTWR